MPDAQNLLKREEKLRNDKHGWNTLFDDLARLAMPRSEPIDYTPRNFRGREILDTTAKEALQAFAAGFFSHLSHPMQSWFNVVPDDEELKNDNDVMHWYHGFSRHLQMLLRQSNFYQKLFECYQDLGWAGTACMYSESDLSRGSFYFRHISPYDYVFDLNYQDEVDTIFVQYKFTPRQASQKFGIENLSEKVQGKLEREDNKIDEPDVYIHCVYPRADGKPRDEAENNREMPFASVWIDKSAKQIVAESGYRDFPYHIARYTVASGESWGTSPTRIAMELIGYVNTQRRSIARVSQNAAEPPWLVPSDNSAYNVSNKPNALIYWQPDPQGLNKPEQVNYQGRIEYTFETYQADQQAINQIYHVDLFRALNAYRQNDRKTATEVRQISQEDKSMLAPFLVRIKREMFDKLLHRIVDISTRKGAYHEEPPEEVQGNEVDIEYGGELFQALQAQDVNSIVTAVNQLGEWLEVKPGVLDWLNETQAGILIARKSGVPAEVINKEEDIEQKQQNRQQMQEAQMAAEAAKNAGEAYEKGGKAPEPGSVSEQMMGGQR